MPRQLTEQEHTLVRNLFFIGGLSKPDISRRTGFTVYQVKRAIRNATFSHRPGRPPTMTPAEEKELLDFLAASPRNRQMSFLELSKTLFDQRHGPYAIRSTLRRLGYQKASCRSGPRAAQAQAQAQAQAPEAPPAPQTPQTPQAQVS